MSLALERRRELRRQATDAETALWRLIRDRRLQGFKFRRQRSVGPFIVDLYCLAQRLAIELDGGQHFEDEALAYDQQRTAYLARRGIAVLRFSNDQVLREPEGVLTTITAALTTKQRQPPGPTTKQPPPPTGDSPAKRKRINV